VTYTRCCIDRIDSPDDEHKIFGPLQDEDEFWRIRLYHELKDLINNADIVRYVKSKNWFGWVM
jgi:hypothetical protein